VSYEERGQWVYLVANLVTFGAYAMIIASRAMAGTPLTEIDYVPLLVTAIVVAVALSVVGRILVEIVNRSESQKADVRDRDIGRRGEYVGGILLGVAMLVPLVLALAEADHFWIANAIYVAFALTAFVSTAVKLAAYRRGF
jgi:hypothetical protein